MATVSREVARKRRHERVRKKVIRHAGAPALERVSQLGAISTLR